MQQEEIIAMEDAVDWHVCGIVVQTEPEKLSSVQTSLLTFPYTDVSAVNEEENKIVVVLQSHNQHILLDRMEAIREIEGVVTVLLVYHEQDEPSKMNA